MRILTGNKRADKVPIKKLRESTKLPSVNQMTVQTILTEAWKIQHGQQDSLTELMVPLPDVGIQTRAREKGNVTIPSGSSICCASFSTKAAELWNCLPVDIRKCEKLQTAKQKIKKFAASFP